jgi:predicted TIM-barrel fold metal-dependent hydrolase
VAEELRMPILFHLGVIGGGVDYSITHPRRDPQAAAALRRQREMRLRPPRDVSSIRMRPFHLDTIANSFPELRIIGAHMGGTGNYDEASSVVRWRHHVFLDMSGATRSSATRWSGTWWARDRRREADRRARTAATMRSLSTSAT